VAALSLPAQSPAPAPAQPAGCGVPATRFQVHKAKAAPALDAPADRALVVFLVDDTAFNYVPGPTTRAGLDGQWMGATRGSGFFTIAVDPGPHHLCANWEPFNTAGALSGLNVGFNNSFSTAEFRAQAGQVYFFLVRNSYGQGDRPNAGAEMTMAQLDASEGRAQLAHGRPTTSAAKVSNGQSYLGGLVKKK
jgi:hypothetical protein